MFNKCRIQKVAIKSSVFLTGFAGLVAEYLLSTLASYLLGDAILQWTIIIALMLLAMGVGARLSRYLPEGYLVESFIAVETLLSLLVGFSVLIAYSQAPFISSVRLPLVIYGLAFSIGVLIGMEIPIAVRINDKYEELRLNISSILEKDYLGALPAGILYATFMLPKLGLLKTATSVALINLAVASVFVILFFGLLNRNTKPLVGTAVLLSAVLLTGLLFKSEEFYITAEQKLYKDPIVASKQTKYQRIVLTNWRNKAYFLYLDGHLQFSSADEKRYHETIVHVPLLLRDNGKRDRILVLGGGDGLVLREIEKYDDVKEIVLVELDPEMIAFAKTNPIMRELNRDSLSDERVRVVVGDAFKYVREASLSQDVRKFDVVIIDLIDPRNIEASRIYSYEFYSMVKRILKDDGVLITQASSTFFAPESYACIAKTMSRAGYFVYPLVNYIPSFGEWGFVLGTKKQTNVTEKIESNFRPELIESENLNTLLSHFVLHNDLKKHLNSEKITVNTLANPVLLRYYNNSRWELAW